MDNVDYQLTEIGGTVAFHFSDGTIAKEMIVPAGGMVVKHVHDYSHLSILAKGTIELLCEDDSKIINAPACIEIKAGVCHGIKAITEVHWFCIHADDGSGEINHSNDSEEIEKMASVMIDSK